MHISIRKTLREAKQKRLEKDQNDQVFAGTYRTKHFEMSPDAQRLYSDVDKTINPEKVERSVKSHDKLFAIAKRVDATGYSTKQDIEQANTIVKDILATIENLGLPAHDHLNTVLKHINDKYENKKNVVDSISNSELQRRFVNVPKEETPEGPDRDIDNIKNHHITRKNAIKRQRYLNVGVDESVNEDLEDLYKLVPGAADLKHDKLALKNHVAKYLRNWNVRATNGDHIGRTHYAMFNNIKRIYKKHLSEGTEMSTDLFGLPKALVDTAKKMLENNTQGSEIQELNEANNPYVDPYKKAKTTAERNKYKKLAAEWQAKQLANKAQKKVAPVVKAAPVAKKTDDNDEDQSMNARLLKGKYHHLNVSPMMAKHALAVIRSSSPKDRLQKTKDIYFSKTMDELKKHLAIA